MTNENKPSRCYRCQTVRVPGDKAGEVVCPECKEVVQLFNSRIPTLKNYGKTFTFPCKCCGNPLEPAAGISMTAIQPAFRFWCPACNLRLHLFQVPALVGYPYLKLWVDEIPRGASFSEYVQTKLLEHVLTHQQRRMTTKPQ